MRPPRFEPPSWVGPAGGKLPPPPPPPPFTSRLFLLGSALLRPFSLKYSSILLLKHSSPQAWPKQFPPGRRLTSVCAGIGDDQDPHCGGREPGRRRRLAGGRRQGTAPTSWQLLQLVDDFFEQEGRPASDARHRALPPNLPQRRCRPASLLNPASCVCVSRRVARRRRVARPRRSPRFASHAACRLPCPAAVALPPPLRWLPPDAAVLYSPRWLFCRRAPEQTTCSQR